jgi:hypothetical protein
MQKINILNRNIYLKVREKMIILTYKQQKGLTMIIDTSDTK